MSRRTPQQEAARRMQKATGMSYCQCLHEVRKIEKSYDPTKDDGFFKRWLLEKVEEFIKDCKDLQGVP